MDTSIEGRLFSRFMIDDHMRHKVSISTSGFVRDRDRNREQKESFT